MSKQISVFFNRSEQWLLVLEAQRDDPMSDATLPCRSHVRPFSEAMLNYWLDAAKSSVNVSVFHSNRIEAM